MFLLVLPPLTALFNAHKTLTDHLILVLVPAPRIVTVHLMDSHVVDVATLTLEVIPTSNKPLQSTPTAV